MFLMALEDFKVTYIFFFFYSEKQYTVDAVVMKELHFYWVF